MNSLDEVFDQINSDQEEVVYHPRVRVPEKLLKTQERAKTYIQFLVSSYEPQFKWTNATLFKDRAALYALANKVPEPKLKSILDWCKSKQVHVRVVLKLLNKELKSG